MEWWEWVAWVVGILGGVTGALLGFVGLKRSGKAEEAASRAAGALEEANRIRIAENPAEKPPWSDAWWISGEVFAIRNNGPRAVVVTGIDADIERLAKLLRHRRDYPTTVDPGDNIEIFSSGTMAGRASPILIWHWEDTPNKVHRTRRGLSKR